MATVPNESASVDEVVLWLDACQIPSAGFATNLVTGVDLRHLEESELISDLGLTNFHARKFKRLVNPSATPTSQIQETAPPQMAPMQHQQAVPPMNAPYYGMALPNPMVPMMSNNNANTNNNTNTVANHIVINTGGSGAGNGENSAPGGVALKVILVDTDGGWESALLEEFDLVDVKLLLTLDRNDSLQALRGKIISKVRARSDNAENFFAGLDTNHVIPFIAEFEEEGCCCDTVTYWAPIPEWQAVGLAAVSEGVNAVFGVIVKSLKTVDGFELDDDNSLACFFGANQKQVDLELLAEIDTVTNLSPQTRIQPEGVGEYNKYKYPGTIRV